MFARARDGHVAEAPLLLHRRVVVDAAGVGEDALLHAGDVHRRKLQSLGGVHGHQRDGALFGIVAVDVRHQRHPLEESDQRRGLVGGVVFVLADLRHELHQVLEAPFRFHRRLGRQRVAIAALLQHLLGQLGRAHVQPLDAQLGHQLDEGGDPSCGGRLPRTRGRRRSAPAPPTTTTRAGGQTPPPCRRCCRRCRAPAR